MNIQGTIFSIESDGGYDSQNGYIYTFQMCVHDQNGAAHYGQIGSKTEIYPLAKGQPIIVDTKEDQHGIKFTKVNPKYAAQGQPGGTAPQTGNTPPLGNQGPPAAPQKAQGPDWDKIADGKVKCNVVCAAIQSGQFACKTIQDAQKYTDYIMGRDTQPQTQSGPQDFNPPPADDSISFQGETMDFVFTKRNQTSVFLRFGDLRLGDIATMLDAWPEGQRGKMAITKVGKPKSREQLGWYYGVILPTAFECFKENGELSISLHCKDRDVAMPLCKDAVDLFMKTSYGGWHGEYKDKGEMNMAECSAFEDWCVIWMAKFFNCHIPEPDKQWKDKHE